MKEELSSMDDKNNELAQEVIRLKSMLKDSVNENEMNNELINELQIKEELLAEKENIISDHLKTLEQIKSEKSDLENKIGELKKEQFKDKKELALNK